MKKSAYERRKILKNKINQNNKTNQKNQVNQKINQMINLKNQQRTNEGKLIITEEQKQAIEAEFNEWKDKQYAGKDKKERQKFAQFFTPPSLTIKMLEKFDSIENKSILDPTLGAGGLLVAAIIAGADPSKVCGIELDNDILILAKRRLVRYGVNPIQLKCGNALDDKSYEFLEDPPKTFLAIDETSTSCRVTAVINSKMVFEEDYENDLGKNYSSAASNAMGLCVKKYGINFIIGLQQCFWQKNSMLPMIIKYK